MKLEFFVPGVPVPKGSMKGFVVGKRALITEGNKARVRPWMSSIGLAARDAGAVPLEGPVWLSLVFCMPRPKSHAGAKGLRPSAPRAPNVKPDIDKLTRAVLDALTGILYGDDAQVVGFVRLEKQYADQTAPGLFVKAFSGHVAAEIAPQGERVLPFGTGAAS